MPSTNQQNRLNVNKLGKNYSIELYVGKKDITKYVYSVRIINNILSAWPIVSIRLGMDCNDIILEDIYGQKEIFLKIVLNTEAAEPQETINFHLLYLQSNVDLIPKITQSQKQYDLQPIEFSAIPIYSMNLMAMFINEIYQDADGPKTGIQIIKDILSKYSFSYQIDDAGSVTTAVPQTIIPPMSFKQMVDYIDKYNGIYNGPLFYNCFHDGTFKMWDLSQKIKRTSVFKIYQLSSGGTAPDVTDNIFKETLTKNVYITSESIQTIYHSNANILKYGFNMIHVLHPDSSLYDLKSKTSDNIVSEYGVINNGKRFIFNPLLKIRKKYDYFTSGARGDDVVTSNSSSNLAKISTLQITLKKDIKLQDILRIGEPITFEPTTLEYMRYSGKYILESYDIQFSMLGSDNWDSLCQLRIFRTMQQQ